MAVFYAKSCSTPSRALRHVAAYADYGGFASGGRRGAEGAMRLESVGKRYGLRQPWVVRDVTLEVPSGRLIRLEGRNGSGKSTLLRVAAGVCRPSAGRVTGRPHTGYVPERFPGALTFSARDYLVYMSRVHGLRGMAAVSRVDEWLDRLGAAAYAGAPLRTLSKGMCQKVAVAQALLAQPGLLILDEAWTGLDQAARVTLDEAVTGRVADGGSVLFVDHGQVQLAGQISERWQLGTGAEVRVLPAGGAAPAGTGPVVVIELSGLDALSLRQLRMLPGVLPDSQEPGQNPGQDAVLATGGPLPGGPVPAVPVTTVPVTTVRVTAAESDRVLRHCLAWDGVHVVAVRAGGPAEQGSSQ